MEIIIEISVIQQLTVLRFRELLTVSVERHRGNLSMQRSINRELLLYQEKIPPEIEPGIILSGGQKFCVVARDFAFSAKSLAS